TAGHKIVRTLGLTAADESCYETFAPLFRAVMSRWQEIVSEDVELSRPAEEEAKMHPDPQGQVILSVQVLCSRNLRGVRMVPSAGREDRREAERLLVEALMSSEDELLRGGDYYPLRGSNSYAPKPKGMSMEMEQQLRAAGQLLEEPQNGLHLSAGLGRHWPQARGVYTNGSGMVVWINQADHLRLAYQHENAEVFKALEATLRVEQALSRALEAKGFSFSSSDGVGSITLCPSNSGSGVQASARLLLPRLAKNEVRLKDLCQHLGLYPARRRELSESGERKPVWE
ncbi:Creatine kinase, partial [Durusdinium trenchii]